MSTAMPFLIAGLFVLGVADIHAQQDEIDDYIDTVGCTWDGCRDRVEVREVIQYVHKTVNGELVLETEKIKAIFEYAPPIKTLDDCTKSEGSDWWNRKFVSYVPEVPPGRDYSEGIIRWDQKFEGPKILPDLQDVVDSGAQRLCVTIVPDFDENSARQNLGLDEIRNSILNILSRNDVQIEHQQHQPQIIWAAIPASLLDDLVENDNVANIDVYGKTLFIPYHIFVGSETKIQSILQQEIDSKMRTCHDGNDVLYDCPLDKNADGKDVFNISILLPQIKVWPDGWPNPNKYPTKDQIKDRREQIEIEAVDVLRPVVELLESNNQTILEAHTLVIVIRADIPLDFLPKLVARDDVLFIESRNVWLTAAGVDPNKKSDTIQEPDIPQIMPSDEIRIELHDDSAIIDITIKDVPKSIPISSDVAGKKTTIHVNNKTVTDYEIVQNDDTTLLVLRPDHAESGAEPVQMSVRQQIKDGVPPEEIQCRDGQPVMMRDRVACLAESSIQALMGRGIDIMRIR